MSSLRPAWKGGRGFQPPPTVTSDTRTRSASVGETTQSKRDSNKFSALDEDDDDDIVVAGTTLSTSLDNNSNEPKQNSRSEAFRSSFGGRAPKPSGRSLADLAARAPEPAPRQSSTGYAGGGGGGGGGRSSSYADSAPSRAAAAAEAKVIRYTREKLLSIRPRPTPPDEFPPPHLKHLDPSVHTLFSEAPQDPVCWDTFDAEGIWALVPMNRRASAPVVAKGTPAPGVRDESATDRRRSYNAPSRGRWERGVALPPPGSDARKDKDRDATNPGDLWDDPVGGATGAAMDFSAFGGIPEDDKGASGGGDAFDFDKMTEASRKFDEELHGSRGSADTLEGDGSGQDDENAHLVKVDPKRPLASSGMTIRSGSGDGVNVFEDFDAPGEGGEAKLDAGDGIKGADQDPNASSRLMAMIGVKKDENGPQAALGGELPDSQKDGGLSGLLGLGGGAPGSTSIPLNPWGDPIIGGTQNNQLGGLGMNLTGGLEMFGTEQKARNAAELEQKELLRRRQQEQEEAQRRAMVQQQEQEERARMQSMQQPQQPSPQAQVEQVLMERISTILENSWGRSDLMSILSTLHSEDSRVIPLLGNVGLLRDLIAHNPRRVALRPDPAFGAEMAVLLLTNAQWQQQQQQEAQARAQAQQQEMRRREEERRMQDMQQRQRSFSGEQMPRIVPDAPWFYSDPQNNIQGPFRGDEMRQWLEAGYFKGDLPISQQAVGPFIPLQAIFPDISQAFVIPQSDPAAEEAAARAAAEDEQRRREEEQRRAEEMEQRRRMEDEQRARAEQEAAERERLEREAAAGPTRTADNGVNETTNQLKMMLGLGTQQAAVEEPQEEPQQQPAEKSSNNRSGNKNNNNQRRQKASDSEPEPEPAAAPAKPAAPAWGGAAQATQKRKSMSEIQKEEARKAAALAAQRGNQPRPSSGWANVAATGTSAWSGGAVKPSAAAVVTAGAPAQRLSAAQAPGRPKTAQPGGGQPATKPRSGSTSAAEEFGTTMSPALEIWCKDQMQKLNGTDDLTLVSFCMTLNDAAEIRQYLTTYLGSTPQVNNFATDFINKTKGGPPPKQDEWETPGSAKKGRKKKGKN